MCWWPRPSPFPSIRWRLAVTRMGRKRRNAIRRETHSTSTRANKRLQVVGKWPLAARVVGVVLARSGHAVPCAVRRLRRQLRASMQTQYLRATLPPSLTKSAGRRRRRFGSTRTEPAPNMCVRVCVASQRLGVVIPISLASRARAFPRVDAACRPRRPWPPKQRRRWRSVQKMPIQRCGQH